MLELKSESKKVNEKANIDCLIVEPELPRVSNDSSPSLLLVTSKENWVRAIIDSQ